MRARLWSQTRGSPGGDAGDGRGCREGTLPGEAPALSPGEEPPVPGLLAELPHFRGHSGRGPSGAARGVTRASSPPGGAPRSCGSFPASSPVRTQPCGRLLRAGGLKEILMHRARQRPLNSARVGPVRRKKKSETSGRSGRRELRTCVPAEP